MLAIRSAKNTLGCLVGCAIGDLGAIFISELLRPGINPSTFMDHRLGCGDELRYRDQCYFGNLYSLEATWTKRSFPDRDWNEYDFHAAYGDCDECGRLWYDGGTGNYFILFCLLPWGQDFLAAWPYNYWRLKKHGKCCH